MITLARDSVTRPFRVEHPAQDERGSHAFLHVVEEAVVRLLTKGARLRANLTIQDGLHLLVPLLLQQAQLANW